MRILMEKIKEDRRGHLSLCIPDLGPGTQRVNLEAKVRRLVSDLEA